MHVWHCGMAKLVGIRSIPHERIDDIIEFSLATDGDRFAPRNPDTAVGQQEAIDYDDDALHSIHSHGRLSLSRNPIQDQLAGHLLSISRIISSAQRTASAIALIVAGTRFPPS